MCVCDQSSHVTLGPADVLMRIPPGSFFAADCVSQTSKHVIHCLKKAHSLLLNSPEEGLNILTKDILALASLLHEYDQLVKAQSGQSKWMDLFYQLYHLTFYVCSC